MTLRTLVRQTALSKGFQQAPKGSSLLSFDGLRHPKPVARSFGQKEFQVIRAEIHWIRVWLLFAL